MTCKFSLLLLIFVASKCHAISYRNYRHKFIEDSAENCDRLLTAEVVEKIASYRQTAKSIYDFIVNNEFKGKTYNEVENFVVLHPTRTSGTQGLEDAIDYMIQRMKYLELDNAYGEQVTVPHWVRGQETAEMLEPFWKPVTILGLGDSVGTPEVGITAPVLVVKDFKELEAKNASVPGKIVVYNPGWINDYGTTVEYRAKGAATASKYGAVAALMESVAPYSLNTPHTGGQHAYPEDIKQIPGASITKEDADMLYRLQNKLNGTDIKMHIKMLDYNLPETISRNVIGELKGKVMETEYVALSGHIDAWDVGQGAMDDAGGVMISVMALAALKQMNLQPYRTLQAILWTSEEAGLIGVQEFAKQHMDILANYSVMFESDSGTFKPKGLDFAGNETAGCMVNEILKLVNDTLGPMEYNRRERVSSDISVLQEYGVPGLNLNNENDKYFYYHHSPADTMYMMSSEDLDLDTALFAITSYVLADLPFMLPRDNVPAP